MTHGAPRALESRSEPRGSWCGATGARAPFGRRSRSSAGREVLNERALADPAPPGDAIDGWRLESLWRGAGSRPPHRSAAARRTRRKPS